MLRQGVAVSTAQGFRERLVRFWSNHFAISVDKRIASLFAAPMERESHPPTCATVPIYCWQWNATPACCCTWITRPRLAMIHALPSMPHAAVRTPKAGKRGLNRNLAREIMELHTAGVNAGYSQADVTRFARAITGWSVVRPNDRDGAGSRDGFVFRNAAHEPGARRVFGKTYRQDGEMQGVAVLHGLAVHPATARHVS